MSDIMGIIPHYDRTHVFVTVSFYFLEFLHLSEWIAFPMGVFWVIF